MYCQRCGSPTATNHQRTRTSAYNPVNNNSPQTHNLVEKLSSRMKIEAIIWLVIGILQIVLGIYTIWTYINWGDDRTIWWSMFAVGALNIIVSITDYRFAKTILVKPVGIVKKIKPLGSPVFTLVYNLIFGGVIGVAGSIYYLICVRGLVMENETQYLAIERNAEMR